jgi:Repeat of unknown function (DUF5648)
MRLLTAFLAVVVCAVLPLNSAEAWYFISGPDYGVGYWRVDQNQLYITTDLFIREEPCLHPNVSLQLEMWTFFGPYWPGVYQPIGQRLATIDLPKPVVGASGECTSQLSARSTPINLPGAGATWITYFLVVQPSNFCTSSTARCYESFANAGVYYAYNVQPQPPIEIAPAPIAYLDTEVMVEYHHADFDHYFVTADPNEIRTLDSGQFAGWNRTGQIFKMWASGWITRASVCRFFSASFAPKSSHFYTPVATECDKVKQDPHWIYETAAGYVDLPVPPTGNCPFGPPIYRLYNNGMGSAPNHRYTSSTQIRAEMIAQGWIPEGFGDLGVIGCSPP